MLESIRIRNIALIEDITIRFHNGMQVLTGETGAGKSIVVDSVNLILGGRAEKEMIRSGCEKASVEAIFHTDNNDNVRTFMDNEEIEYDGQTVTVFREITASGRNVCRICGVIIPVSKLKELAQYLLDLHGQSEHQFLTDQDKQLVFLDQTGDLKHRELMKRTQEACERFLENHRTYAGMVREKHGINISLVPLLKLYRKILNPGKIKYNCERTGNFSPGKDQLWQKIWI